MKFESDGDWHCLVSRERVSVLNIDKIRVRLDGYFLIEADTDIISYCPGWIFKSEYYLIRRTLEDFP